MAETQLESVPGDAMPAVTSDHEAAAFEPIGQWALVWRRFRRHRLAVFGAVALLLVVALVFLGPVISPGFVKPDQFGNIPLADQNRANEAPRLDWPYIMGTDSIGNPIVTYVLVGGTPVLEVGFIGALIATVLGTLIGGIAGYFAGLIDAILMRIVDAFLAIPFLLLLVMLAFYLPGRILLWYVVLFGVVGWPGIARLVRGYILSLREREYAEAARALGVSPGGIIVRHLLPNALDVIVVSFTLNVAVFMVTEVTLDFLGAGPEVTSWGTPLGQAFGLTGYWWDAVFTGSALLITVVAVNFLGDGLRDALDATSPTAMRTESARRRGTRLPFLRRCAVLVTRPVRSTRARARALTAPIRSRSAAVTARLEHVGSRPAGVTSFSPPAVYLPIVAAWAVVGGVLLYGHSPRHYSPHFPMPQAIGDVNSSQLYGAQGGPRGGWDLLLADPSQHVVFRQVDTAGRVTLDRRVGSAEDGADPILAVSGRTALGAWIINDGQQVHARFLAGRTGSVTVNPPGGTVGPPTVVPTSQGFVILFSWQRANDNHADIYAATILHGGRVRLRRWIHRNSDALLPHAVVEGSGAIDVFDLEHTDASHGYWHVYRHRFSALGHPLDRPEDLGMVTYLRQVGTLLSPDITPDEWGIAVQRAPHGDVWATWELGTDIVMAGSGVTGANTLKIAKWSADGTSRVAPATIDPAVDASNVALGLGLRRHGGLVFYAEFAGAQPYLAARFFGSRGRPGALDRVSFTTAGVPREPRASSVNGMPDVVWENARADVSSLETTTYTPRRQPDLATRFGVNLGNLWGNLALLVFGSLVGGLIFSLINIWLLAPLFVLWLAARRLQPALRWPVLIGGLAAVLAAVLIPGPLPRFALVIGGLLPAGGLTVFERVLVLLCGIFVAYWSGRTALNRQESAVRASVMALVALVTVMALLTLLYVQQQINVV